MNTGFYFAAPHYLVLLLVLVPALLIQLYQWHGCSRFLASFAGSKRSVSIRRSFFARMICGSLSWVLAVCALAEPFAGREVQAVKKQGCAVSFVFDISRSMLTADIGTSRLSFAADFSRRVLQQLDGCSYSAVLVKGGANLAIPLTRDRMSFAALLPALDPALSSEPGTNLAAGLECAVRSFPKTSGASCFILYFTDGEALDGNLTAAAAEAKQSGVTVIFIGVGTASGGEVPRISDAAEPIISRLDEKSLLSAASICGGKYVAATKEDLEPFVLSLLTSAATSPQMVYTEKPRSCRAYALILCVLLCAVMVCCVPSVGKRADL